MSSQTTEMIKGFIEESAESFSEIEIDLIEIESNPENLNIINSIFRVMHTIKGTAGFLKLDDISKLSHKIESIFDMIRRQELKITPEIMDKVLPSIDILKLMVYELLENEKSNYQLDSTLEMLHNITATAQNIYAVEETHTRRIDSEESPAEDALPDHDRSAQADRKHLTEYRNQLNALSQEMRDDFLIEAEEHLATVEENLLNLEKNPNDVDAINSVFRAIHSVKGTSDYVNLQLVTRISHQLETIFAQIRKGNQKYTNTLADTTLKAVDILNVLFQILKGSESHQTIAITDTIERLDYFLKARNETLETEETPDDRGSITETMINAFRNISVQQILVIHHLGEKFCINKLEPDELIVLQRSIRTLKNIANNIGAKSVTDLTAQMEQIVLSVLTGEKIDRENLRMFASFEHELRNEIRKLNESDTATFEQLISGSMIFDSAADGEQKIEPADERELETSEENPESSDVPVEIPTQLIKDEPLKTTRVDSERLDTFMNLIGELIITKNSFSHILSNLSELNIPVEILQELKTAEGSFNRISESLQRNLMDMRLVPVKNIFQKIPRIVRDISRKTGKKIQLQVIGEDSEIDKYIIEMIGDPLIHIVRNCCDHGIESPQTRIEAGKPETGNIILKASHLRNNVVIEIIDDGAGLDTAKILRLATDRGLVSPEKAASLNRKSVHNFIFFPGFTTANEITDISGRGVGMDVVNTNIKRINGSVDIESQEGQGTHVTLMLPLTLAIIDALLIVDQGQKYAIPLNAVRETLEIRQDDIRILNQKEAINLRDEIIGVAYLSDLMETDRKPVEDDEVLSVVLLHSGSQVIGILVDDLLTQEEIVVKPLQRYLTKITGLNGSAILGNGEIILILDPLDLINLTAQ